MWQRTQAWYKHRHEHRLLPPEAAAHGAAVAQGPSMRAWLLLRLRVSGRGGRVVLLRLLRRGLVLRLLRGGRRLVRLRRRRRLVRLRRRRRLIRLLRRRRRLVRLRRRRRLVGLLRGRLRRCATARERVRRLLWRRCM